MVFVRAKNVCGGKYYQLVENYRLEGSKTPRQRVLLHLGPYDTVKGALKAWPRDVRGLRLDAAKLLEGCEYWPRKEGYDALVPGYVRAWRETASSMEQRADALETHLVRLKELVRERRKS